MNEDEKRFCRESVVPVMAVDFIYHLNIGELVGSQIRAETQDILMSVMDIEDRVLTGKIDCCDCKKKETLNTLSAMKKLHEIFEDKMKGSGLLTVEQICKVHAVLMEGLHPGAGKIRTNDTYTRWNGKIHFYPNPETLPNRLHALVDCHNIYVEAFPPNSTDYTKQDVEYIFKCAARILFEFVDTHPFGDGNGRMCRLLASYVLKLITPFPVGIHHTDTVNGVRREDYVDAIVQCRDNPKDGPREIASMLLEGAWSGWKRFFESLESCRNTE